MIGSWESHVSVKAHLEVIYQGTQLGATEYKQRIIQEPTSFELVYKFDRGFLRPRCQFRAAYLQNPGYNRP